ncbi:MAG: response regulator, partial [Deltaproteobacteria bacterium]|nr:response regulator [Deltaproteobacteria bacterium]
SITIQKVISITFASEDYDLVVVGDGDAAIAKIKEVKPDMVMADIAMPGKNGYEVCEFIKRDPVFQSIPVLLLAGTFEPINEKEAKRVRADDHIIKPFESQELIEKVKILLAKPPKPTTVEEERPVKPEVKAPMPADIWEVGDFMGAEEAEATAKAAVPSPAEKDIWGVDFFEETPKEAPQKLKVEEEFIELELKEEELQPIEEAKPVPSPPSKPAETFKAAPEIKPTIPQPPSPPKVPPIPPVTPKVMTTIPEKVEAKVKKAVAEEMPEIGAIPKEKLEETIRKVSREVIEEIAWEIIPDLAEELIKEEIRKIKEAIRKVK